MTAKSLVLRALLAVAAIALCAGGALYICVNAGFSSLGPGAQHHFTLDPPPPFLTETLALAKAREALALDGFNTNDWEPQVWSGPTKAPDGTLDKFLSRASWATNAGMIYFRSTHGTNLTELSREYRLRLEGKTLTCGSYRGP